MQGGIARTATCVLTLVLLGLAVAGAPGTGFPVALAQDASDPPEIGDQIVADPLAAETIFPSGACPTNLSGGGYVGEGYRLSVTGPCRPGADLADAAVLGRGVTVPDGDVTVSFKVAAGGARTSLSLYARVQPRNSIGVYLNPGSGEVTLFTIVDGTWSALATRQDGQELLAPDAWNVLSLRLEGSAIWLLLNGETALYGSGVSETAGGIGLRVVREGRVDDDQEATVVFANLAVSALADMPAERAPTYQPQ
ncbi:MAG: hypothetical protein AB7P40_05665 [Chloroflexota bacterium]